MNNYGLSPLAIPIAAAGLLLMLLQSGSARARLRRLRRWAPPLLDVVLLAALAGLVAVALGRSAAGTTLAAAGAHILVDNLRFAVGVASASPLAAAAPGAVIMALGVGLVALGWPDGRFSDVPLPIAQSPGARECACGCGRRLPVQASLQQKYVDRRCRDSAARSRRSAKSARRRRIAA